MTMRALRRVLAGGLRVFAIPVLVVAALVAFGHLNPNQRPVASDRTSHTGFEAAAVPTSTHAAEERPAPPRLTAPPTTSPPPPTTSAPRARHRVAVCSRNHDGQLIVVSISKQRAWMCERTRLVRSTAVTTGNADAGLATPTGSWQVYGKETDRYLTGADYSDFVHYWVPFFGDYGFHDATWQKMAFGSPRYRTEGSHGCVHLPTAAMKWLYDWVQLGATATVVG
jgi:lipoprotein-anchoring transpeptidase ErfK/SrfK